MKVSITILLLLVMLVQSFSKVFIVMDYQVNKNFISEFLCVNKDKLQLHCQGHCYLKKALKKAEQAENQSTNQNLKAGSEITLFYQTLFSFRINTIYTSAEYFRLYLFKPAIKSVAAVFHPPQFTIK